MNNSTEENIIHHNTYSHVAGVPCDKCEGFSLPTKVLNMAFKEMKKSQDKLLKTYEERFTTNITRIKK